MRPLWLIAGRELAGLLRTPVGYWIAAATLLVQGLLFNARAVGTGAKLSSRVLSDFLVDSSGTTTVAAVLLGMRLITDERRAATLPLLLTSPVGGWQIIMGKFLAGFAALACIVLLSLYLPALIFVHGKVSIGHIAGGYAGLLLLGAAMLSLALLASSLASGTLLAGVIAALLVFGLFVTWPVSRLLEPPVSGLVAYLSPYEAHFFPFVRGIVRLSDVMYYASVVGLALTLSVRALDAERWR